MKLFSTSLLSLFFLVVVNTACTDRPQSGDGATGTGTNTEDQTRFDGKIPRTMPAVDNQVAETIVITKEQIMEVQRALNARGADITVNGLESAETSRAVERFQGEMNLAPTGRIDEAVLEKLNVKSPSDRVPASVPNQLNEGS